MSAFWHFAECTGMALIQVLYLTVYHLDTHRKPCYFTPISRCGSKRGPRLFPALEVKGLTYNPWPWPLWHLTLNPWPWPRDLDLGPYFLIIGWKLDFFSLFLPWRPWPMTLTFKLVWDMMEIDVRANLHVRRSNGLASRAQTDGHTQTHGTENITSSANVGGKKTSRLQFSQPYLGTENILWMCNLAIDRLRANLSLVYFFCRHNKE